MNQPNFTRPVSPVVVENNLEQIIRRKIEIVSNIDCGLEPRIGLVLVILGLKQASVLSLFSWNEDVKSVESKLKEVQLFFSKIKKSRFSSKDQTADFAISSSQEVAGRVSYLFENVDESHEEIGNYLGFPPTAIDAFVGKSECEPESHEIFIENGIPFGMTKYALSKENWQEEIKTAKLWSKAIQEKAPLLYKEMIDNSEEI